ncbi:hypothetical protein D3C81_862080 [compost metagenome]
MSSIPAVPPLPFLVVIIIAPFCATEPYKADEAVPFNTVIFSISSAFMLHILKPSGAGTPSMTIVALPPLSVISGFSNRVDLVLIWRPATLPTKLDATLGSRATDRLSPLTSCAA